jgi:hypothetical protein
MNVSILPDKTLLARYIADQKITYIIRGIRNNVDTDYELRLAQFNYDINPECKTIFLPAKKEYENISSSIIRTLIQYNELEQVKRYMDEDSIIRYINYISKDNTIIKILYYDKNTDYKLYLDKDSVINVENIFEYFLNKKFNVKHFKFNEDVSQLEELSIKGELHWNNLFNYIFSYLPNVCDADYKNCKVFYLNWPNIWKYWKYIPNELKGKMRLFKLVDKKELNTIDDEKFHDGIINI